MLELEEVSEDELDDVETELLDEEEDSDEDEEEEDSLLLELL